MMTIEELEKHLFEFEMVRVVFRAPKSMLVYEYPYKKAVGDTNNYNIFQQRLEAQYPEVPFMVIDGYGITTHRFGKKLSEIRNSYTHNVASALA